jgi:hydrogenase expression/formation protein HypC
MCLGVPGQVVDIDEAGDLKMGTVAFGGVRRKVCLEHVPEVKPGQYVLVHVGFALTVLDEAEALRILEYLEAVRDPDLIDEVVAKEASS